MKRTELEIGDVFAVSVATDLKKYFQFIAIDENQLRSDVIRVFSTAYPESDEPKLEIVVAGDVDFYAHCVIKVGIKNDFWRKVGHIDDVGALDVIFRSTKDFGRDWIDVSERWEVWKIGQPRKFVGKLTSNLLSAEHGMVFPPYEIIHRMKNGSYEQPFHS